jgi:hypothetical protein
MELPPLAVEVTAHRSLAVTCTCGKVDCGQFPTELTEVIQYGPRPKALAVYLNQYQLLPMRRSAELIEDSPAQRHRRAASTATFGRALNTSRPASRKSRPAYKPPPSSISMNPVCAQAFAWGDSIMGFAVSAAAAQSSIRDEGSHPDAAADRRPLPQLTLRHESAWREIPRAHDPHRPARCPRQRVKLLLEILSCRQNASIVKPVCR